MSPHACQKRPYLEASRSLRMFGSSSGTISTGKALGEMEVKGKGTISVFGLLPRTAVKTGFSLVT